MKISIVTVCFRSEKTIERTLQSIAAQQNADIDLVIIDGASTDTTVEIIHRYDQYLESFISEKDTGLYDAMNKGVARAKGEYILFLNSDDWLSSPTCISEAVKRFNPNSKLQFGRLRYHHRDGRLTTMGDRLREGDLRYELKNIHQPACFFHRDLFRVFGGFNTNYRVSADYDLIRRFLTSTTATYLDLDVVEMADDGVSATQYGRGILENIQIARRFGEGRVATFFHGEWVRFWLGIRYGFPQFYSLAYRSKNIVTRLRKQL